MLRLPWRRKQRRDNPKLCSLFVVAWLWVDRRQKFPEAALVKGLRNVLEASFLPWRSLVRMKKPPQKAPVNSSSVSSSVVIPRTLARQAPLSVGFSRQGYWSGLPFPSPGDLPYPGIEPTSLTSPA